MMVFPKSPGDGTDGVSSLPERVRYLASHLARPTAPERDRHRHWDEGLFKALSAAFSTELTGGQTAAFLTALGEGSQDPGLALAFTTHAVLTAVPLRAFGTSAQQERYLPRIAAGEWLGALSLRQTQGAAFASTVAVKPALGAESGWVLSGDLEQVVLGTQAHHYLVIAEHSDGSRTAFLLDRDTPGLRIEESDPAAMRSCPWGRLFLDECRVPSDAVLGTVGAAVAETEPFLATLDWVFTSASWLGIMQALINESLAAVHARNLFGAPLVHSQSVRFLLADLAIQNELAAGLLNRAAAQFDGDASPSHQEAATARLFTAAAVRTVAEGAAQLAGPAASTADGLVERAHRDALFFASTGGGAEVLRPVIAASLLGLG
ncbi:acyl-CoA dehydrogenase family protein [Streptomyces sp. SID13031]|uniref:acyl-CoA dehydrogenase family protein n=1 Tax=Streptomyces sp. SID13031 TaxID=2706046 RepID=UPI0013C5EA30|nr:acyl-CoA dehydrogenase family protein [Streptomyces sp. SID13031]NEA34962.1 acyl-CoA dehydrogenase family protein [Streptomyces sp. SID13031]